MTGGDDQNQQNNGFAYDETKYRKIQIEGDPREFLMDMEGNIFDLNWQFIGTANTDQLEEIQDDNVESTQNSPEMGGQYGNQEQQEMMLCEDDEDDMA